MYKNDMKKTWGVISDTLKRNRKSKSQAEFIYENHVIRDTDEIANHFNDYFINIARTLSQQIQPTHSFNNYLNNNSMLRFKFQPVDQNHISQLIDKLKIKQVMDTIIYLGHSMSNHPMVETVHPQILMKIYKFGLYGQKGRFAK